MKDFIAVTLMSIILLALAGCMTTYSIEKRTADNSSIVVTVKSFREFEQPQIHYHRSEDVVTFDFGAESATTARSPIEEAMAEVLVNGGTIAAKVLVPGAAITE